MSFPHQFIKEFLNAGYFKQGSGAHTVSSFAPISGNYSPAEVESGNLF
jgi:hypothetical protein